MKTALQLPSDRSFGLTFAVVFTILGGWLLWRSNSYAWVALALAAAFAVISFTFARVLHPLNKLWMRFGLLLSMIVSPIVLGVIFFVVLVPVGLFQRMRGRDVLRRSFDRQLPSYWILRDPPGPQPDSFPRQF